MKKQRVQISARRAMALSRIALLCAAGLLTAGCSGGGQNNVGADNPGVAGGSPSYNTYIGTQTVQWPLGVVDTTRFQYGGGWTITLDDSAKTFQYENTIHEGANGTPPLAATLGSFTGSNFLSLTANGSVTPGSAGYALEIPGQAVVVRPGDDTVAPVVGVETSDCLTLTQPTTYQFISFGPSDPDIADRNSGVALGPYVAYGSVQAMTSGVTWNFTNLQIFAFDGTDLKPAPLPAGGCGQTALGFAVTMVPSAATNNLPISLQATSTGYFEMDQGQGDTSLFDVAPSPTGPLGLVGVQQPSSQLSTSAVVGAKYLGFQYDAIDGIILGLPGTLPVAFGMSGQAVGSGTAMNGGAYPNDDVTQTPAANITIDLGAQDSTNNGLYKSVTATIPDTFKACVQQPYGGTDANGNPTCIFHGEAVVGNPGGKYAVFVTVNDLSLENRTDPTPQVDSHITSYGALDFFLYQQ